MVLQERPPVFADVTPSPRAARNCPLVVLLVAWALFFYAIWDFRSFVMAATNMDGLLSALGMLNYGLGYLGYFLMMVFLLRMSPWARRAALAVVIGRFILAYLWLVPILYYTGATAPSVPPDTAHRLLYLAGALSLHLPVSLLTLAPLVVILTRPTVKAAFEGRSAE
jgi:hypothetical protein